MVTGLIIGTVVLALVTAVNIYLTMTEGKATGDLQKLRQTKYWNEVERIVETDDWTHSELVRYITEEMYITSNITLAALLGDCHNAADVPSLEKLLTERQAQLDRNYRLYTSKQQNKEVRHENAG